MSEQSGSTPEKLDSLGGFSTEQRDCVTHHYCDCTADRIKQLVEECDRLLSANDTLVARIDDLTEGYALEDTCPRVQCQTTSQRLHREIDGLRNGNRDLHEECQRLRRERDDAINQRKIGIALANEDYDEVLDRANQYQRALERIDDLTQGYALEDTCPRVQCQTTSQRLHRALAVAREHCIEQGKRIETLQDERDGLRNGNRDLHEECQRLRRERDDAN